MPRINMASCRCGTVIGIGQHPPSGRTLDLINAEAKCCGSPVYCFLDLDIFLHCSREYQQRLRDKNPGIEATLRGSR